VAITYGTATTFSSGAAGDNIDLTVPTVNDGERLLVIVGQGAGTAVDPAIEDMNAAEGFTEIENTGETGGRDHSIGIGLKVAASESGTYNFNLVGISSGVDRVGICLPIIGSDGLDVTYVKATHYADVTNDPTPTSPAITTVTNNAEVVLIHLCTHLALTAVAPTGYTIRADITDSANRNIVVATKLVATAGVETPGAWAHTDGDAASEGITVTLALKPTAAGSATRRYSLSLAGVG